MKSYVNVAIALLCTATLAAGCAQSAGQTEKTKVVSSQSVSYDKPGFVTEIKDGRLWVFRQGSKELEEFRKHGELVQQVIRPGAGPNGMTLKAADVQTIDDYLKAR